jgi:hypothetical protein
MFATFLGQLRKTDALLSKSRAKDERKSSGGPTLPMAGTGGIAAKQKDEKISNIMSMTTRTSRNLA